MSTWIHTIDPFAVATRNSRKKMLILITDHTSRLQGGSGDAAILPLYTRTQPVKTDFSDKYSSWVVANGVWKAETNRVMAALRQLSSDLIEKWDITIQNVFRQNTPEYISILPNRRIPFQNGTMEEVINTVQALGIALGNYTTQPALVALKTEVDAFYTDTLAQRNVQQQKEEIVKAASDALEAARIACATMMFRNLGMLIDTYPTQADIITNYFQLDLIQDGGVDSTVEYTGTLAGGEIKNIVSTGITLQTVLYIKNNGNTALQFSLQNNATTMNDSTDRVLQPGEEYNSSTGDIPILTAYYLNVKNQSTNTEGSYIVEVG